MNKVKLIYNDYSSSQLVNVFFEAAQNRNMCMYINIQLINTILLFLTLTFKVPLN